MKLLAWLTLCALAAGVHPALAQSPSVSYSVWSLSGNLMVLRYLLPVADARRLVGSDIAVVTTSKLGDYLLDHVAVQAAGQDCAAIDQGYDIGRVDPLSVGADLYGFEIFFRCVHPTGLILQDTAMFDRLPGHVNFARLQINGHVSEQLFTASRERLRIPDSGVMPAAGMARYLTLGAKHILSGVDRLCFLLGSLLLLRQGRVRNLIAGLASGYVLSLLVSLLVPFGGGISPRIPLLEAFIGFLVAFLAVQMITRQLARPRIVALCTAGLLLCLAGAVLIAHGAWPAWLLAGAAVFAGSFLAVSDRLEEHPLSALLVPSVFGFLDGFVLPNALAPLQLSGRTLLPMLAGFDLGAVLIDVLLSAVLLAGAVLVLRWKQLLSSRALLHDIAAACLGGLGVFWFLSRLHS